jgi:hypothetical protein
MTVYVWHSCHGIYQAWLKYKVKDIIKQNYFESDDELKKKTKTGDLSVLHPF